MATPRIVVEDATGELLAGAGPVVFGTHIGCDVVVDDAIAAARHCEFTHDGTFTVRDLGSVSGTWVDGESVRAPSALKSGSQVVFGTSRVLVEIEAGDALTLRLKLQRQGFWWRKAGKKVFDNDPDALVREEVGFGRFPALRASNRFALIAGGVLLLAATFVTSVMEPLADAGPLLPFHAQVTSGNPVAGAHADFARCQALADEQGCNVCHEGGGIPHTKCLQCHPSLVANGGAHPYLGDGVLGTSTKMPVEGFCTVCHTDHQGEDWLKPASTSLVGECAACHGTTLTREQLIQRSPPPQLPPPRQRAFASYRFPHASHVGKGFDCAVCHRVDGAVAAARSTGLPDDPLRDDFAEVPYETCAACHVPGAAAVSGMSAQQQAEWRAKDHQWNVTWHGTDGGGAKCAQCHVQGQREGRAVFGPEMKTVPRPTASAEQYAAERALYASGNRRHAKEFADHAQGQACTACHKSGSISDQPTSARPFWHALHVVDGALQPAAGAGGTISSDAKAGCVSCHGDLARSNALRDASVAAYHWPDTPAAQAACATCHAEGGKPLTLQSRSTTIAAERRTVGIAFPHDVHVTSASFGKGGSLAEGCFSCHEFTPANGDLLHMVPRTKPGAADCSSCHTGHDDIGGGECQQCHTVDRTVASSFQLAAAIAAGTVVNGKPAPPSPMRSWPGQNAFSHLSRGHAEVACAECHDPAAIAKSDAVGNVPIPDDSTTSCRKCHLQKQFHWR